MEVIPMPERWPFVMPPMPKTPERIKTDGTDENELMIRRVRTHLMKRTTNDELTDRFLSCVGHF